MPSSLQHRLLPMSGRDPHEAGRAPTPLELLFDLTFVIAFGTAASGLSHELVSGHIAAGIAAFLFATFAVSWAWINFSWFASAYDTDDWIFRVMTMVQMVGVLVLALGVPKLFTSIAEGEYVNNGTVVLGYVIMRVAMVAQWLRAARQDPARRSTCMVYVVTILVAQAGWIALALAHTSVAVMFAFAVPLALVEMAGPVIAETRMGGTPWHAHHIAERYLLLVIVTLGEALIGTMATLIGLPSDEGIAIPLDVAVVGFAGVALTFGMWWGYLVMPGGDVLATRRSRSFGWGYGHMVIFGAIVAVGAGIHAAAYLIEGESDLGTVGTMWCVAIPLATYIGALYVLYAVLTRTVDPLHVWLVIGSGVVLAGAMLLAAAGVSIAWCLLALSLVPWVTVVGYEARGYRHNEAVLNDL